MRKICILLVLLSLCLLMVACENQESTENTYSTMTQESNSTSSTNKEDDSLDTSGGDGEEYSIFVGNLDEYNEYVKNNDLIENFITYDVISQFGNFDSFGIAGESTLEYGYYWYNLVDVDGEEYFMSIAHYDERSAESYEFIQNAEQKVNTADLRTINVKEAGAYESDGIMYFYTQNGELLRIRWCVGDIVIFLSGEVSDGGLSKIDINSKKALSKLLKKDTALEALKEIFGSESVSCY